MINNKSEQEKETINSSDKKKICIEIDKELYKDLQRELVEKYGKTFGKIRVALQEGIKMWIKKEKTRRFNQDNNDLKNEVVSSAN